MVKNTLSILATNCTHLWNVKCMFVYVKRQHMLGAGEQRQLKIKLTGTNLAGEDNKRIKQIRARISH